VGLGLSVLLAAGAAAAVVAPQSAPSLQPIYAPEAAWVRPLPIPRDAKPSGAATDALLFDVQSRLAPRDEETFAEVAVRIAAPEGLQQVGNLMQVWDPATQTLTIHRARVLRGDQVIDLLANGRRFTVLRRETNLEAATIDGQLTATLPPDGLQVGDILDMAFTVARHDPALADHVEDTAATAHKGAIARQYVSIAWPAGLPVHTWKTDDMPVLAPATHDGWTQVVVDRTDAVSPEPPKGAPPSALLFGMTQASDFAGWKAVSATAYPLFAKAATLSPGSPLLAEIARIRAASPDPKARALAAFELVENKTRYFALLLNAGGLTPAPADLTWSRRYGDCKGKTVLLLALLHGLGVEAEPALVNTVLGEALPSSLPELESFDHVIVRAEIAGKAYWLDPTRVGDENLDVIPVPNYRWALPLRAQGAALEPLAPSVPTLPLVETVQTVDLTAGMTKPAKVHEDMILRGDGGWGLGMALQQAAPVDRDRALKAAFANADPWVTPDKVGFTYDPQKMEARLTLDGSGSPPFTSENQASATDRDWMIATSGIGYDPDFVRRSDYHRDAPYAVGYPTYMRATVDVRLPDGGKGFEAMNGDSVSRTLAGVEYSRAAAVVGSRFSMVASSRAVAQSFPAAQAAADGDALRSLSEYPVSLRSDASDLAQSEPKAKTAAAVPSQTPGPEAAFLSGDYASAEAMFGKALAEHPTAKLYYDRGAVRAARGQTELAKSDFNAALHMDPKSALAEYALGRYALKAGDYAQADRRFEGALRDSAEPVLMAGRIAEADETAKRFEAAAPYIDRSVAGVDDSARRAEELNDHCWRRAIAGQDLNHALEFCNASIPIAKDPSEVLDSRALVELRLGALDKAVADYDAALAKRPNLWTSLYGRSLAEHRQGRQAAAARDMAAALAANPEATVEFTRWGLATAGS
jgi:tetratricopeptide (TPR) repeat protein